METAESYTTQENPDQIEDASNDHAYFCMMPNMLDDLLDPYQYRLYAHYKRVCGSDRARGSRPPLPPGSRRGSLPAGQAGAYWRIGGEVRARRRAGRSSVDAESTQQSVERYPAARIRPGAHVAAGSCGG